MEKELIIRYLKARAEECETMIRFCYQHESEFAKKSLREWQTKKYENLHLIDLLEECENVEVFIKLYVLGLEKRNKEEREIEQ